MNAPLLEVKDLTVAYKARAGRRFNAVDGVSLSIARGETLALVGESGCGKSSLGRALLGLVPITGGTIELDGDRISGISESAMRPYRRRIQLIFQDNYSALDPRLSVLKSVVEPIKALTREVGSPNEAASSLLEAVGMSGELHGRRPDRLSGGQRQRVGIARALAPGPDLLIADEPVSALDVSVQAQVLNLLKHEQEKRGLACLFISHDLRAVKFMADRIAVMYFGRIVENGPTDQVLASPAHPYTRALISASPSLTRTERVKLTGEMPSPVDPPTGCKFHTRCPVAIEECTGIDPQSEPVAPLHEAACILAPARKNAGLNLSRRSNITDLNS